MSTPRPPTTDSCFSSVLVMQGPLQTFGYLHVGTLRQCLKLEYGPVKAHLSQIGVDTEEFFERVMEDLVLLTFLVRLLSDICWQHTCIKHSAVCLNVCMCGCGGERETGREGRGKGDRLPPEVVLRVSPPLFASCAESRFNTVGIFSAAPTQIFSWFSFFVILIASLPYLLLGFSQVAASGDPAVSTTSLTFSLLSLVPRLPYSRWS